MKRNALLPVAQAQRNKSKKEVETGYFMFWLCLLKYLFVVGMDYRKSVAPVCQQP